MRLPVDAISRISGSHELPARVNTLISAVAVSDDGMRRYRPATDIGLRTHVHGRREDHDAGLARRPARALVKRGAAIAGLGAEAASLRLHRLCLCSGGDVRAVTGPCSAARLASAWAPMDWPVRDASGSEPGIYVGQCAGAAWSAYASNHRSDVRVMIK